VSDEVVAAYRLPQLVRGWEAGLIRFLLARVTDTQSFPSRVAAAFHGREHLTQIERLVDVVAKHHIPVRPKMTIYMACLNLASSLYKRANEPLSAPWSAVFMSTCLFWGQSTASDLLCTRSCRKPCPWV